MNTPDPFPLSEPGALHQELSATLLRLHKALLEAEAEQFGPVDSPFELLDLAVRDERFAWLRRLSELMVELDEAQGDDQAESKPRLSAFRVSIEHLIGPRAPLEQRFRDRYYELLQQSPAAAMAHGDLRRILDKLPG